MYSMCKIEGCRNRVHTKGMCTTHYNYERRLNMDKVCSEDGCERVQIARGLCDPHYKQTLYWARVNGTKCASEGCESPVYGAGTYCWIHKPIKYIAAHRRVHVARGRAADKRCEWCGNDANEWCYDHKDPEELIHQDDDNHYGMPYSRKVEHYLALCTYCHRLLDSGKVWGLAQES